MFLHVANGTSTTRTIEAAGIPGATSIWADPLYEGPVPAGLTDDELREVRSRFLAGPNGVDDVDPVNDLRRWRSTIANHDAYDELVLWYEHDLFDQLNLIQLLSWIRDTLPRGKPVSLICIGEFPGCPDFKGLGELNADELAPLFDTRRRVDETQYSLARRAWQAFREPAPGSLDALHATDTSAMPYLARALTRFLQEYPWTTDGLSRSERRLLELSAGGPIALFDAFPRMHDGEDAFYITDLSLLSLADALSSAPRPLMTVSGESSTGRSPIDRTVAITDAGRAVLDRREDRIAMHGIDRWLGGVHLQGATAAWRWDAARDKVWP